LWFDCGMKERKRVEESREVRYISEGPFAYLPHLTDRVISIHLCHAEFTYSISFYGSHHDVIYHIPCQLQRSSSS
jgi:hypothetical protein